MAVILNGATGGIQLTSSSGGTMSVNPPATATSYVSTLPAATGTLLNSVSSLPAANLTGTVADARISALTASKLTGALPAISGASLTGIASGGMTLLSTTATTSGTTISVATNHTLYNQLMIVFKQVELSGTSGYLQMGVAGLTVMTVADVLTTSTTMIAGFTTVDLNANQFIQEIQLAATPLTTGNQFNGGSNQGLMMYEVDQNLRASASANVSFKYSSGAAFDGGSILIYGLK